MKKICPHCFKTVEMVKGNIDYKKLYSLNHVYTNGMVKPLNCDRCQNPIKDGGKYMCPMSIMGDKNICLDCIIEIAKEGKEGKEGSKEREFIDKIKEYTKETNWGSSYMTKIIEALNKLEGKEKK